MNNKKNDACNGNCESERLPIEFVFPEINDESNKGQRQKI